MTENERKRAWARAHPEPRPKAQNRQNRLRDSRRTFGLCPLCGNDSAIGRLYCEHHLELNRERMHRRRAASKKTSRNTLDTTLRVRPSEKRKI